MGGLQRASAVAHFARSVVAPATFAMSATSAAFAIGIAFPASARAEQVGPSDPSSDDDSRAREASSTAKSAATAFREGRFRDAIALYERALALREDPVLHFNLARACEELGLSLSQSQRDEGAAALRRAMKHYAEYLERTADARDRGAIAQKIVTLRGLAEEREMKRTPPPSDRTSSAPKRESESRTPLGGWIFVGAGVAATATGLTFGKLMNDRRDAAQSDPTFGGAESKQSEGKTFQLVANVSFAAAAVLAITGIGWLIVDGTKSRVR